MNGLHPLGPALTIADDTGSLSLELPLTEVRIAPVLASELCAQIGGLPSCGRDSPSRYRLTLWDEGQQLGYFAPLSVIDQPTRLWVVPGRYTASVSIWQCVPGDPGRTAWVEAPAENEIVAPAPP